MKSRTGCLLIFILVASVWASDYKIALPGYQYAFPRDHFDHPDYQTEWWYYTGNLKSKDGHRFGFELTFFRHGTARDTESSTWHIHDVYMAHLALSDLSGKRFYYDERMNRAGPGVAGVDQQGGLIWNGNWQTQFAGGHQLLRGVSEKFGFQLDLKSDKPPVIHGQQGISQKAEGAAHASHYISFTRLLAAGLIELNGVTYQVEGTSWMDHEFFTESTETSEVGWDWLSLQLDDHTELMLYRLRHKDGSVDPYSSGSYVDAQGKPLFLSSKDFGMTALGETWTSSRSKGIYPLRWHVSIPSAGLELDISTPLPSQELVGVIGPSYWEGAIDISGQRSGKSLHGIGYLEMTGYGTEATK